MSDAEERAMEVEVLMSIYDQDFSWVQEPDEYNVQLAPTGEGEGSQVHVSAVLHVTCPSNYPSESAPVLFVEPRKGLSKKQVEEMKELADETSGTGLGGPSVFSVCEALKEWLSDNNVAGQDDSMYAQMLRREQQKGLDVKKKEKSAKVAEAADAEAGKQSIDPEEQARIRKRQAGQQVTPESFATWLAAFENERKSLAAADLAAGVELDMQQLALLGLGESTKMSGKEIWLRKQAGGEPLDDGEGGAVAVDEAGNVVQAMAADGEMDAEAEARLYERIQAAKAARLAQEEEWSDGSSSEYIHSDDDSDASFDDDFDGDGDDDDDDEREDYGGGGATVFKVSAESQGSAPVTRANAKKAGR